MENNFTIPQNYQADIGLEVHVQLSTRSKIFCGCSTSFGAAPNSQTCPVCLGLPGTLPVLNKQVVEFAVKMGLATHSRIRRFSRFARKNYFYPDLPKGYQISQFDEPVCEGGFVAIMLNGKTRRIEIIRIHMEEDAGKSVHNEEYVRNNETFIDLNRCGVPLIEIVSEPQIHNPSEAGAYLASIRQLVRYLEISDGNMEEGSLRCDANISVRKNGQQALGVRTELKNMNSIHNVERALQFEILRQASILENGGQVVQETLLWDVAKNEARSMRGKEESHDYRYFPEPDLPPVEINALWLDKIRNELPELPAERRKRMVKQYGLSAYESEILTADKTLAEYFEQVALHCSNYKLISNWLMGEVLRLMREKKISISAFPVSAQRLAGLLKLVEKKAINGATAKKVFEKMFNDKSTADDLVEIMGLKQISERAEIEKFIGQVLSANSAEVRAYRAGKVKLLGFFMGQVMRLSQGKANPALVKDLLKEKLNEGV